jgi:transposase
VRKWTATRKDGQARGKYALELRMEADRLVEGGQTSAVAAKVLGIPQQMLDNWLRLSKKGKLKGAGDRTVSAEQMELARLRAENVKLQMERGILKKLRRISLGIRCEVRLDSTA